MAPLSKIKILAVILLAKALEVNQMMEIPDLVALVILKPVSLW
jgi:hypothetical protein